MIFTTACRPCLHDQVSAAILKGKGPNDLASIMGPYEKLRRFSLWLDGDFS